MDFEAFENDAMNKILDGNDRKLATLRKQYSNAKEDTEYNLDNYVL